MRKGFFCPRSGLIYLIYEILIMNIRILFLLLLLIISIGVSKVESGFQLPKKPITNKSKHKVKSNIDKPNILFIAIDDMNDWVGYLGGHS